MEQVGNVSPSTKAPKACLRSYWRWDRKQCGCIGLEPCHETGGLSGVVPGEAFKSAAFVLSFLCFSVPPSASQQSLTISSSICFSAKPDNLFPPSASQQTLTICSLHLLRRTDSIFVSNSATLHGDFFIFYSLPSSPMDYLRNTIGSTTSNASTSKLIRMLDDHEVCPLIQPADCTDGRHRL
ncbi:hypothetical protein BDR22DRAFT_866394 [Usnea florida]